MIIFIKKIIILFVFSMSKTIFILACMLVISTCFFDTSIFQCSSALQQQFKGLKQLQGKSESQIIDGLAQLAKNVSTLLKTCGMSQVAQKYQTQVSQKCINDLDKAAKIINRLANETDNQAKAALDVAILQRLYKTKLQKECKFLNEKQFNFRQGGVCLQSAYKFSLLVQNFTGDLGRGNLTAALDELELILSALPDTLDACGQSTEAQKIRKDFPAECLKSIDSLGKELLTLEHNYQHLEWLMKHGKQVLITFKNVKVTCPAFQ